MNQIESYLSGAVEYDALSDAERCAICASLEGRWVFCYQRRQAEPKHRELGYSNPYPREYVPLMVEGESFYLSHVGADYTDVSSYFAPHYFNIMNRFTYPIDYFHDSPCVLRLAARFAYRIMDLEKGVGIICVLHAIGNKYGGSGKGFNGIVPSIVAAVCVLARAQWPYKVVE